jgi:hypothetical protein
VREGLPYNEETFRVAYLETLPSGSEESPRLSELWSRELWKQLQTVSVQRFVSASKQPRTFSELLYRVWGKSV